MAMLRLRAEALDWCDFDGELVALEGVSSTYIAVNESGALLWRELATGTTRDRLVERLLTVFDVAPEIAARDVDAFLDDCRARGLLEGS